MSGELIWQQQKHLKHNQSLHRVEEVKNSPPHGRKHTDTLVSQHDKPFSPANHNADQCFHLTSVTMTTVSGRSDLMVSNQMFGVMCWSWSGPLICPWRTCRLQLQAQVCFLCCCSCWQVQQCVNVWAVKPWNVLFCLVLADFHSLPLWIVSCRLAGIHFSYRSGSGWFTADEQQHLALIHSEKRHHSGLLLALL